MEKRVLVIGIIILENAIANQNSIMFILGGANILLARREHVKQQVLFTLRTVELSLPCVVCSR